MHDSLFFAVEHNNQRQVANGHSMANHKEYEGYEALIVRYYEFLCV